MATYHFKTLKDAQSFKERTMSKGYFVDSPRKTKKGYSLSVLTKRGGTIILKRLR